MSNGTNDARGRVLKALESPQHTWRTIRGVAKDTGLDVESVASVIDQLKGELVRSSVPAEDGSALYTTRTHYRARAPIYKRILNAILNRAD